MKAVLSFLVDRLGLQALFAFLREHKVPRELQGPKGWFYIFGQATLFAFALQLVTGIALSTVYVPSPAHAHESLLSITHDGWPGRLLRAMHYFGASAMIVLIGLHAIRVFLTGSFKFPREMNWITGVILLVLTLVMALTGQLLRWDQNGLWTVVVAAKFVARVPLIGPWLAKFVLGGDTVTGDTLSRFFALHAIVVPAVIVGFIGIHMFLVVRHGISEPPRAGEPVDPKTYRAKYQALKESGARYFPDVAFREIVVGVAVLLIVVGLAIGLGPKGPAGPPDPTDLAVDPRPDWFVRWYYALLWLKPRGLESFVMIHLPLLVVFALLILPLVNGKGERSPMRRPVSVAIVASGVVAMVCLTVIGIRVPWSPDYGTKPLDRAALGGAPEPQVLEGAQAFHARGCQYCHKVLDRGGSYGPDLTRVTERIGPPEITARIVVGYDDMPGYRDTIPSEELSKILAFLGALPAQAEARR
jgi:ubiquinol-cytochrome c reductase cytochrome b subunit